MYPPPNGSDLDTSGYISDFRRCAEAAEGKRALKMTEYLTSRETGGNIQRHMTGGFGGRRNIRGEDPVPCGGAPYIPPAHLHPIGNSSEIRVDSSPSVQYLAFSPQWLSRPFTSPTSPVLIRCRRTLLLASTPPAFQLVFLFLLYFVLVYSLKDYVSSLSCSSLPMRVSGFRR